MTRTITFLGARGGQGTSTIAAAAALFAAAEQPTILVSDDPAAAAALIGIPVPVGDDCVVLPSLTLTTHPEQHPDAQVIVVDAGTLATPAPAAAPGAGETRRYVVLRGPCYVALATILATAGPPPDGLVLVMEPGRALSERDVSDVLGIPVAATIAIDPAVARTIDAGILTSRLARTRALAPLRPLICDPFHRVQEHTDLQPPLCGGCGCAFGARGDTLAGCVEHRSARARCCGLLHRRGRDVGGGLLLRPR
jgi:hypothetical protein